MSGSEIMFIGSVYVLEVFVCEVLCVILEGKLDLVVIEFDGDRLKSLLRSASEDRFVMYVVR